VDRGELAGALAEDEEVRERVAAQPVGAVHPAGDLAGGEEAGDGRLLGLGVDPDAAHHVVAGRADLHRVLGDIDVSQLLELVVHPGELADDLLGGPLRGDIEEDAAVGRASALDDLAADRSGDDVAGQQLGRAPGVGSLAGHDAGDPAF
jgi:hypothetical protein